MKEKLNIDRIFAHIGELGSQQKRYMFLLCLMNFYAPQFMIQYTFVGHSLDFTCITKNGTLFENSCLNQQSSQCETITFDTSTSDSIISEWNLVCDREWLSPLSMTIFMAGVMTGSMILGFLADRIGRKKTLLITFFMVIVLNGVAGCLTSFKVYLFFKFATGFFKSGYILAVFVLMNELIGPSKRGMMGTIMQSVFAFGIVFFAIIAYYVPFWRKLTLTTTALGIPIFIYGCLALPESPRWLLSKGNIKQTIQELKNIAIGNKTHLDHKLINDDTDTEDSEEEITVQPHLPPPQRKLVAQDSITDILKDNFLIKLSSIQIYCWFVNCLSYYGLTIAAGDKKSLYWGTAMSGFVEVPAYGLMLVTLIYFGRKTNLAAFMSIGGIAMLLTPLFDSIAPALVTWLGLIGKLCLSSSFSVAYIYSNETFPTTIRNSGMGMVSLASRIGGMLAPYFAKLGSYYPNLHFIVFGILSLTSGLTTVWLPETKDLPLPETLADLSARKVHVVSVQSPHTYKKVPLNEL